MAHQPAKKILRVKTTQEKTDMQATRDQHSQSTKDDILRQHMYLFIFMINKDDIHPQHVLS